MGPAQTHQRANARVRRWVVPGSKRPMWRRDSGYFVVRNIKVGTRVRSMLHGQPSKSRTRCWGDKAEPKFKKGWFDRYKREETWGFTIREFTSKGAFTYIEMRAEARDFVNANGPTPIPEGTLKQCLDADMDLLRRYEAWMRRRFKEKGGFKALNNDKWVRSRKAQMDYAKKLVAMGICPLCGDDLPCADCCVEAPA